jgi:8-oxo-dGTP pyrophosphatase MutT (NUDIX family)
VNPLEQFLADYGLDPDLKLIHPVTSVVIFDEAGNVLAVKRSPDDPGEYEWELIGGGREEDEADEVTAARETSEETKNSLKPRLHSYMFSGEIKRIREGELPFPATLRVTNVPGVVEGVKPEVRLDEKSHVEYRWIPIEEIRAGTSVLRPVLETHVLWAYAILVQDGWLS